MVFVIYNAQSLNSIKQTLANGGKENSEPNPAGKGGGGTHLLLFHLHLSSKTKTWGRGSREGERTESATCFRI